ncbi:MAG: HEPN domain-containing protein [Spirochaetales bacterium]|nr:HEPN domain-containing protein [Spirochaetales bacterium]
MANSKSSMEWLTKAYHNLSSAIILFEAKHYTDTIGNELQQAMEKSLKAFLSYDNKQIKKTHDLLEISELVTDYIKFNAIEMRILNTASDYYTQDRYPAQNLELPTRDEIKDVMDFAQELFNKVCNILDIDKQEVMK